MGIWKNFDEIEESLTLRELEEIVTAGREREHRNHKFMAALQGHNLDEATEQSNEDKFNASKMRAQAFLEGRSFDEVEFDEIGFGFETDEEEI